MGVNDKRLLFDPCWPFGRMQLYCTSASASFLRAGGSAHLLYSLWFKQTKSLDHVQVLLVVFG